MLKLGFVEVVVQAAFGEQIVVRPDLYNASVLHGHNFIRVHDGGILLPHLTEAEPAPKRMLPTTS